MRVTGGTEVGHADGQYSHYNGYKLDFSLTSGLSSYIKNTFTRIADRGSYPQWQAASGNVYCVSVALPRADLGPSLTCCRRRVTTGT